MAAILPILAQAGTWIAGNAGTIATAASIGSAGVGALGAVAGARAQAGAMEANAAEMERAARDKRVASSIEAERLRRQQRVLLSRDRAGMAQSGALSGTNLDLLDQNRVSAELDALTVEYSGTQQASSLERQAALDRSEAGGVRSAGWLGAFGQGLGGFASIDPLNFGRQ